MKQLPITSDHYTYLEKSFGGWLSMIGYSSRTVYGMPLQVRELFHYLEQQHIKNITGIQSHHIKAYYQTLKQRSNKRHEGGLSSVYINKHKQALQTFFEYLRQSGRAELPQVELRTLYAEKKHIQVLTTDDIKELFQATYISEARNSKEELGERDRAMLTVFYGAGLRRSEGQSLNIRDINFEQGLLHVKKGKGNKERFVPLPKSNLKHLENYIYNSRYVLLDGSKSEALFISQRGTRMNDMSINNRLQQLVQKTQNPKLIEKNPSLHTLRHSIATHLLQNGMKLEHIAKFLGHASLDSTQIYTHLLT